MLVKSKVVAEHVKDLESTFEVLRKYKLRLNAAKCSFGVGSGKFLGYMVTHRRIEVNPDQIRAINELQAPQNPKEVQKLTGMTVVLNRFISRSANRCQPFFSLINKWKGFKWIEECAVAFQQLKDYLARPPIMSSPEPDEVLFAYIAVTTHAISLVLIRAHGDVQKPVYCLSKSLHEAEVRYLPLEKAILAVVHGTRKLPHYFQAHTVVVLTQLPLRAILQSADYTGRIAKWETILGAFDIKYMPHTSVKGQVLADLVAEFTEPRLEEVKLTSDMDKKLVGMISQQGPSHWEAYVDGAANQRGSRVGLVLISPEGIIIEKALRLGFSATNNEAEYEALLMGMSMVQRMGGKAVKSGFESFSLLHIPRSGNSHADSLATLATSSAQDLPRVILVEDLHRPTEAGKEVIQVHQGNGQAEAVNKVIVNGLKKRLDDTKGKWVEELPHVLWAYRTTPRRSTGETPFSMTYGAETIIPLETGFPTLRTSSFSPTNNNEQLEKSLDLIDERRENTMVRLAHYQQKLRQGYDANVRLRPLEPGDLVLRKVVGVAKSPP
ncbi:uncharacterized protein LOC136068314 [Quercus suber]|uniref:uncharacterized protein LOC136068314 n=1 Tax=Quercus suber TaxID=58331 RepID=UPI0032E024BD